MPEWDKIKAEYISGVSYRKLADKYNVSRSALSRRMHSEHWQGLREQAESKANADIAKNVARSKVKNANKIDDIADKLLALLERQIESGEYQATVRGFRDLTGALKDLKEIKGVRSELDDKEQQARIDKLRKEVESGEEQQEIKVVISSDVDDFTN